MSKKIYRCIGIMTGNSLDAVDVVLTEFHDSHIKDICGFSLNIPTSLSNRFRQLKFMLAQNNCNIKAYADKEENHFKTPFHENNILLFLFSLFANMRRMRLTPRLDNILLKDWCKSL